MFGFEEKLIAIAAQIQWEIVYIFCTEFLDLQKNWISQTWKIQRKIVYIIYVLNVWICRKIECPELRKLNWKLCTLYVRNVWLCRKIEWPDLQKFDGKLCTFSVRNFWICRKIEYPKLPKFNAKLCTLYTHGTSGFAENLNVQNCGNWTRNFVCYKYVISGFAEKLNAQNSIKSTKNSVH